MLYEYDQRWIPTPIGECDTRKELAGCILLEELKEYSEIFHISQETLDMCGAQSLRYRKGMQSGKTYSFGMIPLFHKESGFEEGDRIGILIGENVCLIVIIKDSTHRVDKLFTGLVARSWEKNQTAKLLYTFLDELLEMDTDVLENMDFHITRMEEKLVKELPLQDFYGEIFSMKRKLLLLRSYYEQLLEIGERLYGNDNKVLRECDREQFQIFTERVKRFRDNVLFLNESLVEIRAAYESYMDLNMNATMKFLTVITTVFMPLTLLTGWYGMNFQYMPELGGKYSYLVFVAVSVIIFVALMIYFKKKKYF